MKWFSVLCALIATTLSACAGSGAAEANPDRHITYLHGAIVEQGLPAISDRYGEYEVDKIVAALGKSGSTVYAPVRELGVDVPAHAQDVADYVLTVIAEGTEPADVTIIGASKGAYIAALVSDRLNDPSIRYVLLAGCSPGVVDAMLQDGVRLSGAVLTIRDRLDTNFAGSCEAISKDAPTLSLFEERVVDTGLEHGLIYTPNPAWLEPTLAWASGS